MTGFVHRSIVRTAFAFAVLLAGAPAAPAAYCAMYSDGSRSCGIPSFEMCRQSVAGVGGSCQEDFTDQIPPNYIQRMRREAMPPSDPLPPPPLEMAPRPASGAGGSTRARVTVRPAPAVRQRPITTSPCMSLSGDTCGNNLY